MLGYMACVLDGVLVMQDARQIPNSFSEAHSVNCENVSDPWYVGFGAAELTK
jgi:hypothetical protein